MPYPPYPPRKGLAIYWFNPEVGKFLRQHKRVTSEDVVGQVSNDFSRLYPGYTFSKTRLTKIWFGCRRGEAHAMEKEFADVLSDAIKNICTRKNLRLPSQDICLAARYRVPSHFFQAMTAVGREPEERLKRKLSKELSVIPKRVYASAYLIKPDAEAIARQVFAHLTEANDIMVQDMANSNEMIETNAEDNTCAEQGYRCVRHES